MFDYGLKSMKSIKEPTGIDKDILLAANKGDMDTVLALLDVGADVNTKESLAKVIR